MCGGAFLVMYDGIDDDTSSQDLLQISLEKLLSVSFKIYALIPRKNSLLFTSTIGKVSEM